MEVDLNPLIKVDSSMEYLLDAMKNDWSKSSSANAVFIFTWMKAMRLYQF